jgi:hypothetical protein
MKSSKLHPHHHLHRRDHGRRCWWMISYKTDFEHSRTSTAKQIQFLACLPFSASRICCSIIVVGYSLLSFSCRAANGRSNHGPILIGRRFDPTSRFLGLDFGAWARRRHTTNFIYLWGHKPTTKTFFNSIKFKFNKGTLTTKEKYSSESTE